MVRPYEKGIPTPIIGNQFKASLERERGGQCCDAWTRQTRASIILEPFLMGLT